MRFRAGWSGPITCDVTSPHPARMFEPDALAARINYGRVQLAVTFAAATRRVFC